MPNEIFIKPRKPEFIVYKPNGLRLKKEGEFVKAEPFWYQRLKDQDVVVAPPPKATPNAQAVSASASPTSKNKGN